MLLLPLLFFVTALLYASVGFGGGSTYNALLVLGGVDYRLLPTIALICNLIVVTGGVVQYARAGQLSLSFALPFVVSSVPLAWYGGQLPVRKEIFVLLLGLSLLLAALAMFFQPRKPAAPPGSPAVNWFVGVPLGSAIGLVAGVVGIGGGIFLAPCLHLLRLADTKRIAATASFFIMLNSAAGLLGQSTKHSTLALLERHSEYLWLAVAVFVGGQVGSRLSARVLSGQLVRRLTAVLVLYVSGRLLYLWYRTWA